MTEKETKPAELSPRDIAINMVKELSINEFDPDDFPTEVSFYWDEIVGAVANHIGLAYQKGCDDTNWSWENNP